MNTVTITRFKDDGVETLGTLKAVRESDGAVFTCETLELPWKDNDSNVSCVPLGKYYCSLRAFHATQRYELLNVPNRFGVFIHDGNYYTDILGCILIGIRPSDINGDGQIDVTSSVMTNKEFISFMQNQPFTLTIE